MGSQQYSLTFGWKTTVKVSSNNIPQIKTDTEKMMNNAAPGQLQQVMAKHNITDYEFISAATTVTRTGNPYIDYNPIDWIKYGITPTLCEVEGTTTITFLDQAETLTAVLADIFITFGEYLTAHIGIVLVGVIIIAAIVAFVIISATVTNTATGIADAINKATSTLGGSVVSVLLILFAALVVIVVVVLIVPTIYIRARKWFKRIGYNNNDNV